MRPVNPAVMPPRSAGMGSGPRNPTSMPPRDPGMGAGPRSPMPRPTSMPMTNVKPAMPGMKKGGSVKSASSRADGCAQRGKTKGKII